MVWLSVGIGIARGSRVRKRSLIKSLGRSGLAERVQGEMGSCYQACGCPQQFLVAETYLKPKVLKPSASRMLENPGARDSRQHATK